MQSSLRGFNGTHKYMQCNALPGAKLSKMDRGISRSVSMQLTACKDTILQQELLTGRHDSQTAQGGF